MGENELDYYGLDEDLNEISSQENNDVITNEVTSFEDNNNDDVDSDDIISRLLKSKGISDTSKIKFENESGEIEEKDWNSLSSDEQYNILSSSDLDENYGLDDNEIDLINSIRSSRVSVNDYMNYIKQQGIKEYLEQNNTVHYTVDDYTDDELYVADMQARFPDMTEDEITNSLDHDKSNESLYQRKIDSLRQEYKDLEDKKNQMELAQQEEERAKQAQEFSDSIVEAINQVDRMGSFKIELEDDDMQDIYDFLTQEDKTGVRYIARALNDPKTLVKMAWFALKGDDAMKSISDYYAQQIKEVAKTNYAKGLEDAKKGKNAKSTLHINNTTKLNNKEVKTIDDLYDLD